MTIVNSILLMSWDTLKYAVIFLLQIIAAIILGLWLNTMTLPMTLPLLGIGAGMMPIAVNQNALLNAGGNVIDFIEDALNTLLDIASELWACIEPVLVLLNILTEFFFSLGKRVTKAIPGVPNMFTWARMAQMERVLKSMDVLDRTSEATLSMIRDAKEAVKTMSPRDAQIYLRHIESKFVELPNASRYHQRFSDPRSIASIIEVICEIIRGIIGFVVSVMNIFLPFVLDIVDFILDFFIDPSGTITNTFEVIFVRFIINTILEELGFAECFKDLPGGLIVCLCPWRYDQPYAFPPPLDIANDALSGDALTSLAFCICPNFHLKPKDYSSPIDALLDCFGINTIIDAFMTAIHFVQTTVMTIINGLQTALNGVKSALNSLSKLYEDLLGEFKSLCKVFNCKKRSEEMWDQYMEFRTTWERGSRNVDTWLTMWEETIQNSTEIIDLRMGGRLKRAIERMSNDSYIQRAARGFSASAHLTNFTLGMIGKHWRRESSLTFAERIFKRIQDEPALDNFFSRILGRGDASERSRRNYATILRTVKGVLQAGRDALNNLQIEHEKEKREAGDAAKHHEWYPRAMGERWIFDETLAEVDIESAIEAVYDQSAHVNEMRGDPVDMPHPLLRKCSAGLELTMTSVFAHDNLPNVARHLVKRFGNDTVAEAAGFAARVQRGFNGMHSLKPMENMRAVLDDLGIDDTMLTRELQEQRELYRQTYHGRRDQLRMEMNEAWERSNFAVAGGSFVSLGVSAIFHGAAVTTAGSARIIPVIAPLGLVGIVVAVPFFLMEVLNIVLQAGSGIIIAATSSSQTRFQTQSWNPITPNIPIWFDMVIDSFKEPLTFSTIEGVFEDTIDVNIPNLWYVANYLIRGQLGKLPLPIGSLTSPPLPTVDSNGVPTQNALDYITDWLFCDPTTLCGEYDSCGSNQPCRCPVDDSLLQSSFYRTISVPRQRTAIPNLPCRYGDTSSGSRRGKCLCHPFIPTGQEFNPPKIDWDTDLDCQGTYGYDSEGMLWAKVGFWDYLSTVWHNTYIGLRTTFKAVLFVEPVNNENLFVVILGACPCACMWPIASVWSQSTLIVNSSFDVRDTVTEWFANLFKASFNAWLLGDFFRGAYKWVDGPNPDGAATCLFFNGSGPLQGTFIIVTASTFALALILTFGWVTLILWVINVLLYFVLGLPFVFLQLCVYSSKMAELRMAEGTPRDVSSRSAFPRGRRRAVEIIRQRQAKTTADMPTGDRMRVIGRHHLREVGLEVHSGPAHIANLVVVRRTPHPKGLQHGKKPVGWGERLALTMQIMFRSLPLVFSRNFIIFSWRHHPLKLVSLNPFGDTFDSALLRYSNTTTKLHGNRVFAIHDEHSPLAEGEFPFLAFIATENGSLLFPTSVYEDPHYAVCDPHFFHGRRCVKHVRHYAPRDPKKKQKQSDASPSDDDSDFSYSESGSEEEAGVARWQFEEAGPSHNMEVRRRLP